MSDNATIRSLEEGVISLFQTFARELPQDAVSLEIGPSNDPLLGGTRLELIPTSPTAAKIFALVLNRCVVYVTFGSATPFEAQIEDGNISGAISEIKALCEAVIEGKFEEDIWFAGPQIFKSVGRIDVGKRTNIIHYRGSFHPFERTRKKNIKYSSYVKLAIEAKAVLAP
jgi:hypothetical protein